MQGEVGAPTPPGRGRRERRAGAGTPAQGDRRAADQREGALIDDDLATDTGDEDGPGRRGTGATLIVEKVCGAAAEAGATLAELAVLGRHTVSTSRSMAVALSGAAQPGLAVPSFELAADEVELGVGIHGERAATRAPFGTAGELMRALVDPLAADLGLRRGDGVLVFVNGMGATHPLELSVCFREVHRALGELGCRSPARWWGRTSPRWTWRGCR